jgi:hypothetical protein
LIDRAEGLIVMAWFSSCVLIDALDLYDLLDLESVGPGIPLGED